MEAEVLGQHIIIAGISADGTASCATNATPHAGRKSSQSDTRVAPIADLSIQLGNAAPVERMEMLVDLVRSEVCRILQLPREKTPHRDDRLMDLGVDSLMALELRSRIEKVLMLDQPLSSTLIFDCPTIAALARHLDNLLFPHTTEILRGATETGERLAQMLDTMSDADAEAVLLRKLQGL
jgi:acyl carrier protein